MVGRERAGRAYRGPMDGAAELSRPARRLRSELADDGIVVDADGPLLALVLDELGYARRPTQFERRTPLYGSMVVPDDRSLVTAGELVDLIPVDDQPLDRGTTIKVVGMDGLTLLVEPDSQPSPS